VLTSPPAIQGNPTKSAQAFDAWLNSPEAQEAQAAGKFDTLRFSIFGLGNSSYGKTFNQMGRDSWQRLKGLCGGGGDATLHEYGEGDANVDAG
jgi:sulfite reductase alpha subunit-like flavoprotein